MSGFSTTQYRSPDIPKGHFSQVGRLHIHVDGGGDTGLVVAALSALGLGKLNVVTDALAGPQREEFPTTYASHTPVVEGQEVLEYFSTSHLASRDQAIYALNRVLPLLANRPAIVVEVEHVIAKIDSYGRWSTVPIDRVLPIESVEVGFECAPTLPFEIHHAVDISSGSPSLTLRQLLQETTELGVRVGGWFSFTKENVCAYRSNAFSTANDFEGYARTTHELLDQYLRHRGVDYQLWTLIERVIGVWRTPLIN